VTWTVNVPQNSPEDTAKHVSPRLLTTEIQGGPKIVTTLKVCNSWASKTVTKNRQSAYCVRTTNVAKVASSARKISVASYVRVLTSKASEWLLGLVLETFFKINDEICTVGTLSHARDGLSVSVVCTVYWLKYGELVSPIFLSVLHKFHEWPGRQVGVCIPQIFCGGANSLSFLWLLYLYSAKHGAEICRVLRSHLSSLQELHQRRVSTSQHFCVPKP